MKKKYAMKIKGDDFAFRFCHSRSPLYVEEQFSDGNKVVAYLPYITEVGRDDLAISLEGESPVPTYSISVWDYGFEMTNTFKNVDYESADVTIFILDEDDNVTGSFTGYLTDFSGEGNMVDFTVRKEEDEKVKENYPRFESDSFQFFKVHTLKDVGLTPTFEINNDTPWKVAKAWKFFTDSDSDGTYEEHGPTFAAISQMKGYLNTDYDRGDGIVGGADPDLKIKAVPNMGEDNRYRTFTYNINAGKMEDAGLEPLFDDPSSTGMNGFAWIGQPYASNYEKVEYDQLTVNPDGTVRLHLISGLKYPHDENEPVRPVSKKEGGRDANHETYDVIYVKANSYLPTTPAEETTFLEDPHLGIGFINIGGKSSGPEDYHLLHRYEVIDVLGDILKLKIHDNPKDTDHEYVVDTPFSTHSIPLDVDAEQDCKLADLVWLVGSMSFFVDGIDPSSFPDLQDHLRNRLRGLRVDMIKDYESMVSEIFDASTDNNYSELNANLLNNATGDFAVVTESEIKKDGNDQYYEYVTFKIPDDIVPAYTMVANDEFGGDETTENEESAEVGTRNGSNEIYTNTFLWRLPYTSKSGQAGRMNLGLSDARSHYMSKKYRIIFDPVPENSQDLGKNFPVVYGYVERVPLLHVISKKTYGSNEEVLTAGDDAYVYASHPCDIKTPHDIVLELLDEQGRSSNPKDLETVIAGYHGLIRSPFPSYVDGHYKRYSTGVLGYVGKLYHPYHRLDTLETLDGLRLHGIRLRGGEWDSTVGTFDKRYPIRNGVGSSTVYGSFGGYVDTTGEITGTAGNLIEHPVDIFHHFIKRYGYFPYNENILDVDNLQVIKSQTFRDKASVYLSENISPFTLMSKLASQFGLYYYYRDGKVIFSLGERGRVDHSKPISERLNLIQGVKEEDEGYKDIYSKIVYRYGKNWATNNFEREIVLDSSNNLYCSKAAKARGGKKDFVIDADYVRSSAVARRVATVLAKRLARRRTIYTLKVRSMDGIEFYPGDMVPVTYSPLKLDRAPVLVLNVSGGTVADELTVVKFSD